MTLTNKIKPGNKDLDLNLDLNLHKWEAYISQVHSKSMDFTLNRVRSVAEKLGNILNPDAKIITIAGTNGKGSTASFLSEVFSQSGKKTGLFTSPHLININERFRINGVEISDHDLCNAFSEINKARGDISLTYFEFCSLAAFVIFNSKKCDIWILEVGLGGRLDSVNIIDADIAILTTVDLDHTDILGNSIEAIATEKMGIFRSNQKIFCGERFLYDLVSKRSSVLNAKLYCAGIDFKCFLNLNNKSWGFEFNKIKYNKLPMPNIPMQNISLALCVLHTEFPEVINNNKVDLINIISNFKMLGRMSIINSNITGLDFDILFDGAHNPQAARNLANNLKFYKNKINNKSKLHIIFSALSNKDIFNILNPVCEFLKNNINADIFWYLPKIDNIRAAEIQDIKNCLLKIHPSANVILESNNFLGDLKQHINIDDFVLAFGSFFLLGCLNKDNMI